MLKYDKDHSISTLYRGIELCPFSFSKFSCFSPLFGCECADMFSFTKIYLCVDVCILCECMNWHTDLCVFMNSYKKWVSVNQIPLTSTTW